MSRSRKKPYVQLTHQIDKDYAHKAVRTKVKAELRKENPDLLIIEADTKEMGKEEWGTKFGWDSAKILDDDEDYIVEEKKKLSRK